MNFLSPIFSTFNLPELQTIRMPAKENYLRRPVRIPTKPIENFDSILSILCINCQELIPASLIEKHSVLCVSVTESVVDLDIMPLIIEAKFKLEKLQNCLEGIVSSPSLSSTDKNYILVIIRFLTSIQASNDVINVEKRIASIKDLLANFKGSISTKLYMDRFLALATMLKESISIDIPEQAPEITITPAESKEVLFEDLSEVKGKIEHYKNRAKVLEKVVLSTHGMRSPELMRKLDAIQSELGSNKSYNKSGSSVISQDDAGRSSVMDERLEIKSEDDLKKYFYSLCLSQKIKYTSMKKNPPNLSIQRLYADVTQQGIPPEAWFKYVVRQFEFPDSKFMEGLPRRSTAVKKVQHFEAIIEEEH